MTWYVTAWAENRERADPPDPELAIWTLSEDPDEEGWDTDAGSDGYGLTKARAEELASAANNMRFLLDEAWCAGRDAAADAAEERTARYSGRLAAEIRALKSPCNGGSVE